MKNLKAWLVSVLCIIVVVDTFCGCLPIKEESDTQVKESGTQDIYNKDFGKPMIWAANNIIFNGKCSINKDDIVTYSDEHGVNRVRAAFVGRTLVYWSETEKVLVQLGEDGAKRVIHGIPFPAAQVIRDIIPIRNGLLINTDKYILDSKGEKTKDSSPLSAYRFDMKSGNCTLIDDAISARGNSTSDTIAIMTHNGEFKIIDASGKISSVPNIRTTITFRLSWDFDPSHNLLAVLDGKDWVNLRVFRTTGEIVWKKRNDTYGHEVVFQPSIDELWVAVNTKEYWGLFWQIDTYSLQGESHGIRYLHAGTDVNSPLMPAEDWMKDILAIAESKE